MVNWSMPGKNLARRLAVSGLRRPAKTAVFLPAADLLCVKQALATGCITQRTSLCLVEQDLEIARQIAAAMKKMRWRAAVTVLHGRLESVSLTGWLGRRTLDYAFLDTCSPLSSNLLCWIGGELNPNLSKEFRVAITTLRSTRAKGPELRPLWRLLNSYGSVLLNHTHRALRDSACGGSLCSMKPLYKKQAKGVHLCGLPTTVDGVLLNPVYRTSTLYSASSILASFWNRGLRVANWLEYQKSHATQLMLLTVEPGKSTPPLSDALDSAYCRWLGDYSQELKTHCKCVTIN